MKWMAPISILMVLITCGCSEIFSEVDARGAKSIDELKKMYTTSHRMRDLAELRPALTWHLVGFNSQDKERRMKKLMSVRLRDVEFVKDWRFGDDVETAQWSYSSPTLGDGSGPDYSLDRIYGRYEGRLLLHVSYGNHKQIIDPAYLVSKFNGRFYLYANTAVLMAVNRDVQLEIPVRVEFLGVETGHTPLSDI